MKKLKINSVLFMLILITFGSQESFSQSLRGLVNEGVENYNEGNFSDAEVNFKKGVEKSPESFEAKFNLGDAFFKQERYDEAIKSGWVTLDDTWEKFVYSGVGVGGIQAPVLTTNSLSATDLAYWANRAYKEYYFRPSYILDKLLSIRSLKDLKMYYNGYKMLKKDTS